MFLLERNVKHQRETTILLLLVAVAVQYSNQVEDDLQEVAVEIWVEALDHQVLEEEDKKSNNYKIPMFLTNVIA